MAPDSTAVRVALWRAMHVALDAPPHVLEDEVGLGLVAPDEGWRRRGDMDPEATRAFRAGIVARTRFIEDMVAAQPSGTQYVILGAGLDTFAQRKPEIASRGKVFEVDRPGPQAWKRQRLVELGYAVPDWLRLVAVDFEAGGTWWDRLAQAGFDTNKPALVASTGVSMYITKDATATTLAQIAGLAPGSTLVMTFQLPLDSLAPADQPGRAAAERGARASGTPFISFFTPAEMLAMARAAGFTRVEHVSSEHLAQRYLAGRPDGLRNSTGEDLLVAGTS